MRVNAFKVRLSRSGTSGRATKYAQQVSSSHVFNSGDRASGALRKPMPGSMIVPYYI
jgi:hypothetical protein